MGWWSDIVDVVEKPFEWAADAVEFFVDASISIVEGILDVGSSLFGMLTPDLPSSPTYKNDYPTNTINEGIEIPRAYGRVRLAGNILRVNSPDQDQYMKMLVGHCEGPIDQVLAWYANSKDLTTLKESEQPMLYAYASGSTTQTLLQVDGSDLFTEKYAAYRGLAYSGLKLWKESEDLGGSFPSINAIARTMKCTPIAKTLTATTYTWIKSSSGTSEFYCTIAGANSGVSSPQYLYLNDISKTTAILGSLTTGTWNYGDNDALGYNTPYVRMPDSSNPNWVELNTDANAISDPKSNEANATTGWTSVSLTGTGANVFESQAITVNTGSYAFHANANDTPTNVARIYKDIELNWGLVSGHLYLLSFDIRHVGVGGDWRATLSSSNSDGLGIPPDTNLILVSGTSTTFETVSYTFIHSNNTKYFVLREASTTNNGGIYLDNLSCKALTSQYEIKVEEEKTFSRNPAVILWDWYRHVENYSVNELDNIAWKSLESIGNQIPTTGGGAPIRPPGPSKDTVKSTSAADETDTAGTYYYYGCYAFDINRSIDGSPNKNSWLSRNMQRIPFIGDYLGMTGPGRQRLNVDLGVDGILTGITLVNYHDEGNNTDYGVNTFSIQCSNTSADLARVAYPDAGSSWVSIPQIFNASAYSATTPEATYSIGGVSQTTIPYRYYSLKLQNNQGDNAYMGLRDCCFWIKSRRYTFDYIYDNDVEVNDAKKLIWQSFNGCVIRSQGKLKPVFKWWQEADGYGGVTDKVRQHTFTESNIIKDSFAWSIPERYNSVEIEYLDPNENFKKTSIRIRDDDDISIRGEIPYKETCYFITAQDVARRRAQQRLNEAMYVRKRCKLKGMDDASDLEIYDLSGVSHILAPWEGAKDFLILSKTENIIGECEFELEEYYPGIYNDQQAPVPESYYAVTGLLKEEPKQVRDLTLTNSSFWNDKGLYNFQADVTYLMPTDNLNIAYLRYQYSLLESGGTVRTAGSGASLNLSMDTATYASATTNMILLLTTGTTAVSSTIVSLDAGASNQITINGEIDAYNGGSGCTFKYLKFIDYSKGVDHSKGSGFKFDASVAEVESGNTLYVRAIPVSMQGVSANQNNCTSAMCEFKINFNTEIAAIDRDCKRIFPKGVYELTSAVTVPDYNITIAGVNRDAVVVQNYPASHALVLYNNTTKQFTFQDFTIQSTNTSEYSNMIYAYSASTVGNRADIVIDNINFNCNHDGSLFGPLVTDYAVYSTAHNQISIKKIIASKGEINIRYIDKFSIQDSQLDYGRRASIDCSYVTSAYINNNIITNFTYKGINTYDCYNIIAVNNKATSRSDTSMFAIIMGIDVFKSTVAKVNDNIIEIANTSGNSTAYGIYLYNTDVRSEQEASRNTINIEVNSNLQTFGLYIADCNNSIFTNNTIKISNADTSNNHFGISSYDLFNSGLNNNTINMVNSSTKDIAIYLHSDTINNQLLNNGYFNTGTTTIWNLGANNNIGTNTEPGLNITTQDGGTAKSFMSFS